MNWFKEKCSHLYEEIGKCYDRIDYGNGTHINAYIVKKCKICGNITAKTVYSNEFTKYANKLKELSKPDFIEICRKLSD